MINKSKRIAVFGAGGWGTALSCILADIGHKVTLWAHESQVVEEINTQRTNSVFLPGVSLPKGVKAQQKISSLRFFDYAIIAVPTRFIRSVLTSPDFPKIGHIPVINVSKGIEHESLLRISEIVVQALNIDYHQYIVLSGPSHAEEAARKMPTTVVAASENHALCEEIQELFSSPTFRVYSSDDVIGCEIGGSLKNVIAIAAGIIDGLGLGDNTKAALITRGLAEISRLGVALGANTMTFSGLSGLGDLFVTCNSKLSRNRYVGEQLGKGRTATEIQNEMKMVAEGINTTESAYFLGKKHGVEMPIAEQMFQIIFKGKQPEEAIKALMNRQTKREWWW